MRWIVGKGAQHTENRTQQEYFHEKFTNEIAHKMQFAKSLSAKFKKESH